MNHHESPLKLPSWYHHVYHSIITPLSLNDHPVSIQWVWLCYYKVIAELPWITTKVTIMVPLSYHSIITQLSLDYHSVITKQSPSEHSVSVALLLQSYYRVTVNHHWITAKVTYKLFFLPLNYHPVIIQWKFITKFSKVTKSYQKFPKVTKSSLKVPKSSLKVPLSAIYHWVISLLS